MLDIEKIKKQVGYNEGANLSQIKLCSMKLRQAGLPEIPNAYAEVLRQCNGFSNEDARIFGAEIKNNNWYTDIFAYNQRFFDEDTSKVLILGFDDMDYFVYNADSRTYMLVDKDTGEVKVDNADFSDCVGRMLRITD